MDTGFLNSLELAMHEKAYAPIKAVYGRSSATRNISDSSERITQVNNLLESSDQLLSLHQKAARAISDGAAGPGSYAALEEEREKDRERTRQLLAVGKRVYERELDGIDQQAKPKDFLGVDNEVLAQANQLFGGRKVVGSDHDSDRTLKYMQKGIRKMTKGLDYGA